MLETNVAAHRWQVVPRAGADRLGRRIDDVAKPLDRDAELLKVLPHLRQPKHRLADLARQHVEGDELPDGEDAVHHLGSAEP